MIDTGALRKEIINLAVQGKLVSQKSDEGDTEDIYDLLRKKGKKHLQIFQKKTCLLAFQIHGDGGHYPI